MRKHSIKNYLGYFAPGMVLTVAGFLVAYQFVAPAPPRQITLAAGPTGGVYYDIGQKYSAILARDRVSLTVVETSGSVENLRRLADRKSGIDVIIMQGGVGSTASADHLVSLGSIYYEPLWVFHRRELTVRHLTDLKGMQVAVGLEGSGTRQLALQLLTLNGVTPENSRLLSVSGDDTISRLKAGAIDAAFFVVGYRGRAVQELLYDPDITLMNFGRGAAYAARLPYLTMLTLPEGAVDFTNNIPGEDIRLLAPTAQLVTRDDFHPALVDLILQAAGEIGTANGLFETAGEFPAPMFMDFPLSSEAGRFYKSGPPFLRRYLPFWLANFLIRMKIMLLPLLALVIPLMKLLPIFYRWRVRRRIFRWYALLEKIDFEMLHGDSGGQTHESMRRLNWIEQKLSETTVPLGYSKELYDMRIHIEMLRSKLVAAGADPCASSHPLASDTPRR